MTVSPLPDTTAYARTEIPPVREEVLTRRRIYIFPTRPGLMFASVLAVMLLGAINYNNSLSFLIVFLLGGMSTVSIFYTYRNLAGLRIRPGTVTPVFVGEFAQFALVFDNRGQIARFSLRLAAVNGVFSPRHTVSEIFCDVSAGQETQVRLPVPAVQRGLLRPGALLLETTYPLGLFRAWTFLELGLSCLVYPAPLGGQPLPEGEADLAQYGTGQGRWGEDFIGYRDYALGDSPRHVDWKIVAKDKGWFIKVFGGQQPATLWLDWAGVHGTPERERMLSQLCQWVLDADAQQLRYGLRLPGVEIAPAYDTSHREQCLRQLALFELEENG